VSMTTVRFFVRLWFNPEDGRWMRGTYGLHCGNPVEAKIDGQWVQTRIEHSSFSEHSNGWYLVTHPNLALDGLQVVSEASV